MQNKHSKAHYYSLFILILVITYPTFIAFHVLSDFIIFPIIFNFADTYVHIVHSDVGAQVQYQKNNEAWTLTSNLFQAQTAFIHGQLAPDGFSILGQTQTNLETGNRIIYGLPIVWILIFSTCKNKVLSYPAAKRALELFYLERYTLARKEWNFWLSQLSESEKLVAASVAYQAGWFDRPIFTLAAQGYLDDVNLRFPMAYAEHIKNYANKYGIDASWAFAIARRESSFMRDAHSSAGAKGLMQIMPATAKQLEKRTISNRYLYNAKNNIKLGTKYLERLLSKNKGNSLLATASYNAGPYRVKQWLENEEEISADIWVETIPFKETREYVKSVFAYQQIYKTKLNETSPSPFKVLLEMKISP